MRVVQINAVCGTGSTGKICTEVSRLLSEKGFENYVLHSGMPCGLSTEISYAKVGKVAALKAHLAGNWGFEAKGATRALLRELDRITPDIIHLHNIHNHACNLDILFDWIRRHDIKVFWTFHDCWAFTGYCMHYTAERCGKWKAACGDCPQRKAYSWFLDKSAALFQKKKQLYEGVDLTVIAPSQWMRRQVEQSFLCDRPVRVIHNGIDLSVFRPSRRNDLPPYILPGKHIVLGVAYGWSEKKGLGAFVSLSKTLPDRYQVVLIGVDDKTAQTLPAEITAVGRTKTQEELAAYYSAAKVFVNPTLEDTFPTVNIEALACGTPVLTYDTGGSPEIAGDSCGAVVPARDTDALAAEVIRICEQQPFSRQDCVARAASFDKTDAFMQYVSLYESLL